MSKSNDSTLTRVDQGIHELCDKLKLTPFVRARCLEMSGNMEKEGGTGLTGSPTNAVACSIVSIVHEEALRGGRVTVHLPDKMIGKVFGMDSGDIIRGKHIMNARKK